MMLWAVIAEWAKGGSTDVAPSTSPSPRTRRPSDNSTNLQTESSHQTQREASLDRRQRKGSRERSLRARHVRKLQKREHYRENLKRGLRLGHEITLEDEDGDAAGRRVVVAYKKELSQRREFCVNTPQKEVFRISWTMEHDGDRAQVDYNYNSFTGHNVNWMLSGSGGPVSITSRGEVGGGEYEHQNDLTVRSNIRSHPVETGFNGAIRINYDTDNVDFRWKGAVKYPIMRNAFKISHGLERQELFGCCWTLKAEMKSEELPWKAVRVETTGPVEGASTRVEHVKAEIIRNLSEAYDFEYEVKKPFTQGGTRWSSRLRHRYKRGLECLLFLEGEDTQFGGVTLSCNYGPVKNTVVSCSAGLEPDGGWNMSTAVKLGEQKLNEMDQNWNMKAKLQLAGDLTRRQAEVDLYVPLRCPLS